MEFLSIFGKDLHSIIPLYYFSPLTVLGIEPRAMYMLCEHSTTEVHPHTASYPFRSVPLLKRMIPLQSGSFFFAMYVRNTWTAGHSVTCL